MLGIQAVNLDITPCLNTVNVQNEANQQNVGNISSFVIEEFSGSKVAPPPPPPPIPQVRLW